MDWIVRMFVHAKYDVQEVFSAVEAVDGGKATLPDGNQFRSGSQRIQLFFQKGVSCVVCKIEGNQFFLEAHREYENPHLNLYAVNENGDAILMTKDHILPKSRGGSNTLDNYQTMCSPCNFKKGNKLIHMDLLPNTAEV